MSQSGIINLSDAGGGGNVVGPGSSTINDVAVFADTTGKVIKDSGLLYTNIVTGPASVTSDDLASYNGTTGKLIKDSGIATASVPITFAGNSGTATASSNVINFLGTGSTSVSATGNTVTINSSGGGGFSPSILSLVMLSQVTNVTGDGTNYPIVFDTQSVNIGSWVVSGASVTIPVDGTYLFNYQVSVIGASAASNHLGQVTMSVGVSFVTKNANNTGNIADGSFGLAPWSGTYVGTVANGTVCDLEVFVNGGAKNVSVMGNAYTTWNITRIA